MSKLHEFAASNGVPDDVRTKVELSEPVQRQPLKGQMRFTTFDVLTIYSREKVMLEAVNERSFMPEAVLYDEEIPPAFQPCRSLLFDFRLQPGSEGVSHFILTADEGVTRVRVVAWTLRQKLIIGNDDRRHAWSDYPSPGNRSKKFRLSRHWCLPQASSD